MTEQAQDSTTEKDLEAELSDFETDDEDEPEDSAAPPSDAGQAADGHPEAKQAEPSELDKLREQVENYKKALIEERAKRQEAQRFLEHQIFQARFNANRPQEAVPQKADDYGKDDLDETIAPLVKPVLEKEITPLSQEMRMLKAQLCEQQARLRHPDYDQVVAKVLPVIQQDPNMHQLFLAAQDPAEFAYNMGRMLTIDERIAAAREEGRRQALAELQGKLSGAAKPPQGLSGAATAGTGGGAAKDLDTISVEEAAKLSAEEWAKLPQKTRDRLLGLV